MSGFENFQSDANELETEIVRRGIVLGSDWNNETQVRLLAGRPWTMPGMPAGRQPPAATTRNRPRPSCSPLPP